VCRRRLLERAERRGDAIELLAGALGVEPRAEVSRRVDAASWRQRRAALAFAVGGR